MRTTNLNIIFFTFAFSLFTFSLSFAQVSFKNGTDNVLLQVNDYGATGTVTLPPFAIFPILPINSNMLLNFDGTLYWNGSALGTSNNAGGWTHSGTKIYNTTVSDNVGIGTTNPLSKLSVGGDGSSSSAVYGEAMGSLAKGVSGFSSASGIYPSYGGYFTAEGAYAQGVVGEAIGTYGHGGDFRGSGDAAKGVWSQASGVNAYAGYFIGRGYFSGNVGIETENPLAKLSVGGDGDASATIYGEATSGWGVYGKATTGRGLYGEATSGYAGYFEGRGYFTGNVGIGTANPSSKLSVGGSGLSSASISAYTSLVTGIGVYSEATASNAYAGYFDGRGYFTGNVGIGQTSPTYRLHVKDDQSNNFVARIENTSIGTDADGLAILLNVGTPASSNHFIRFQKSGGAGIGSIDGSGSQVFYNTTSDARLKMNIKEYSNALNVLSSIGIKKYERISNPGIEEIGVIAQELQKVYPQAVSGSPDSDVKTDPMMVDYSKLTPLLVKAVQEQQGKIKELEKQNAEIKSHNTVINSKNEELENRLSKIESLLDGKRFTTVSN
ncbi:MAG: tail fiber domain-containing protein [Ignavibacteriales bacterium]|nr:tail fiber domain-containing protein [Ignavibacteriales bacterium]